MSYRHRLVEICLLLCPITGACSGDDRIEEIRALEQRVCACPDKACVDKVRAESADLEKKLESLSSRERKQAQASAVAMMACAKRIADGD